MSPRFFVFSGLDYYPCGGWKDFQGAFATLDEARAVALYRRTEHGDDWSQIVDMAEHKIIEPHG